MIKISYHAAAASDLGQIVFPLLASSSADKDFEKRAAPVILPEVARYIANLKPINNAQYVLVNAMGASEFYGCFPSGTVIQTSTGEKSIETIRPGELVRTHKNRYREVKKTKTKMAAELCDLYVTGLPKLCPALTATPNHLILAVRKAEFRTTRCKFIFSPGKNAGSILLRRRQMLQQLRFSWVPIADLQKGDYVVEPFPLEEDSAALGDVKWNTPEVAFLMGLYAAEGCVSVRYDKRAYYDGLPEKLVFVTGAHEKATHQEAARCTEAFGHHMYVRAEPDTHSTRLEIHWKKLAVLCAEHIGTSSTKKRLSQAILTMPVAWQDIFFRAYAGGDGHKVSREGRCRDDLILTSASAGLLHDVRLLAARIGLVGAVHGRHNTKAAWYNGNPIYNLLISGGQFRDGGQPKTYLHPHGYLISCVKKVTRRACAGLVHDLCVDEDTSYVANGFAVHNSNINCDHFEEEGLIHCPDNWRGIPEIDKLLAKDWPYGFPTFYNSGCYCFVAGTNVVCGNRVRKAIDKIVVGDEVQTSKGLKPVRRVFRRAYVGPGVKLLFRGEYEPLTGTASHEVLCYRREQIHCKHHYSKLGTHGCCCPEFKQPIGAPTWIPLADVRKNDYLVCPVPALGTEVIASEFAELVGWVAADGYINKKGYLQFSFAQGNKAKIDTVTKCLQANGVYVGVCHRPQYGLVVLTGCSTLLCAKLRKYIKGTKAEKTITGAVLFWDADSLRALLRAFISGDGHVPKIGRNKGQLRIRSASPQMLRILADCMHALGVPATVQWDRQAGSMVSPTNGKIYQENGSGVVAVASGWSNEVVSGSTRATGNLAVNDCRQRLHDGFILMRVRDRSDLQLNEDVYNLEVDDPHDYLASEVLVHNCHHRNKNASRSLGEIELTAWNPRMRRVELIIRLDKEKCDKFGGTGAWDKLKLGQYLDLSMGSKVPFDCCHICTDWDAYNKAKATFDPKKHKYPGEAILHYHKDLIARTGKGIRGLSPTRATYCEHMKKTPGKILPDGKKVFVYNAYPRFFDISIVFIGADKTAKVMYKIASDNQVWSLPGAELAESLGYDDTIVEAKTASAGDDILKEAFLGKISGLKKGEIEKHGPTQFDSKAVPLLTKNEPHIPDDMLDEISRHPLDSILSSSGSMGIALRPREFQRIVIIKMGLRPVADDLDDKNVVFPRMENHSPAPMDMGRVLPGIVNLLSSIFGDRSALSPAIDRRITVVIGRPGDSGKKNPSSLSNGLLNKIGSAYTGYRESLMNYWSNQLNKSEKTASTNDRTLTYLRNAYWSEVGR